MEMSVFWGKAEVNWPGKPANSVANDPTETSAGKFADAKTDYP
jgi:hypothetical protein